ncbi:putative BTB/POZ domain-containing protein KCTD9 [Apostichopus japonicus]|uniref:Putative BTB/POZ domain-containing protein KCTD9 n=1 Tax=Stichopus japonicus TaxID=307972 RepID=A0A2G8L5G7_STIJA|nr:putative BTB/POZ domain-containing protein KCTD9 [Apostichopus japonicus]
MYGMWAACDQQTKLLHPAIRFSTLYMWSSELYGKVIHLSDKRDTFLTEAGSILGINATVIYNKHGGRIDNFGLIRDDDVLYLSEGEPFIDPQLVIAVSKEHATSNSVVKGNILLRPLPRVPSHFSDPDPKSFYLTKRRSTLTQREPESMLARMFGTEDPSWNSAMDRSGAYLIDRSPKYFEPIMNYLRHGQLIVDTNIGAAGVLEEAKFFGMTSLIEPLKQMVKERKTRALYTNHKTRVYHHAARLCPEQRTEMSGADLAKLDLRFINFKMANLSHANLSGANMAFCSLERTNLSFAKLDQANLQGVKMVLANLEGASLKSCNFEDPAGSKANMEGVNMMGVNLENSQMAGVNLRVAKLKNANLQNSNLRRAVLAGTDLENCNLTGCDLQEANLRGANTKNAKFEDMITPLHMSQSVR